MRRQTPANQHKVIQTSTRLAVFVAVFLISVAEVLAQEQLAADTRTPQISAVEPARRILISIPDRKLALIENGAVVKTYPIAVGAEETPSPEGQFKIINRITRPTYYAPGTVIRPGRANPLGTRWMGLSRKGYGIHGTNEPKSIGQGVSHGCIRMRKADVEELFELVRVGDVVELHATRTGEVAAVFPLPPAQPAATPGQAAGVAAALTPR